MTVVISVGDHNTKVTVSDGEYQEAVTLKNGDFVTLTGDKPRIVSSRVQPTAPPKEEE
jgi:hypothetical protein